MEILEVIDPVELEGIKRIKCDTILKSSWNHSKFIGVVINEEYCSGDAPKIMTVGQMKSLCNNQPDIEFINVKNYRDDIFKFVSKDIGFSININSDTQTKIISADCDEVNKLTGTPMLRIIEKYSKAFRISEDNEVMSIDQFSDYELIKGLFNLVAETTNMKDTYNTDNFREKASRLLKDIYRDTKPMEVF